MPKVLDPVADHERHLTPPVFSALWVNLGLSWLAVLMGVRLTAAPEMGGLGLTVGQVALVGPVAILASGLALAVVARIAFQSGLSTGMLLRPSFGVAGSWLIAVLVALAYLIVMAFEFRVSGHLVSRAVGLAEVNVAETAAVGLVAVVVGLLSYLGVRRFSVRIVYPFLMTGAGALVLVAVFWFLQSDWELATDRAPAGSLVQAGQIIFLYALLFLPLVVDTTRFAQHPDSASYAPGFAFVAATSISMLSGAILGSAGAAATATSVMDYVAPAAGWLGALVLLSWVTTAEIVQPFGFLYAAANAAGAVVLRRPPRLLSWAFVAVGALAAIVFSDGTLMAATEAAAFVVAPAFVVVVVDYHVIRHTYYRVDEMYDRAGDYGGVNLSGFVAYVVGLGAGYVVDPKGPDVFLRGIEIVLPFAGRAADFVPAVAVSATVTGLAYWALGRWRVRESDIVSHVRI